MSDPIVFVGSSSENSESARAITSMLGHDFQPREWTDQFHPSSTSLNDLIQLSESCDFAILIADGDDITVSRKHRSLSPRDNIIFELGLFGGKIGFDRCYVVHQKGQDLKLPSDLRGWTPSIYKLQSDGNIRNSLRPVLNEIIYEMKRRGPLTAESQQVKFMLIDCWNGLALDSQVPANAPHIPVLWTPHGQKWQQWFLEDAGNGNYYIRSAHRNFVLGVTAETQNFPEVSLQTKTNTNNQKWRIAELRDGLVFRIEPVSFEGLSLSSPPNAHIPASKPSREVEKLEAPILLDRVDSHEHQQWIISKF